MSTMRAASPGPRNGRARCGGNLQLTNTAGGGAGAPPSSLEAPPACRRRCLPPPLVACPTSPLPALPARRAIVFNRLGGIKDEVYEEGTHLMLPWFERPIIYDVRASLLPGHSAAALLVCVNWCCCGCDYSAHAVPAAFSRAPAQPPSTALAPPLVAASPATAAAAAAAAPSCLRVP